MQTVLRTFSFTDILVLWSFPEKIWKLFNISPAFLPLTVANLPTVKNSPVFSPPCIIGWLGSRVVSVLDSEGPGFKSQPRYCRVAVLGKLLTPIVTAYQAAKLVAALLRGMTSKTATNQNGHMIMVIGEHVNIYICLLYTSPSPRD